MSILVPWSFRSNPGHCQCECIGDVCSNLVHKHSASTHRHCVVVCVSDIKQRRWMLGECLWMKFEEMSLTVIWKEIQGTRMNDNNIHSAVDGMYLNDFSFFCVCVCDSLFECFTVHFRLLRRNWCVHFIYRSVITIDIQQIICTSPFAWIPTCTFMRSPIARLCVV